MVQSTACPSIQADKTHKMNREPSTNLLALSSASLRNPQSFIRVKIQWHGRSPAIRFFRDTAGTAFVPNESTTPDKQVSVLKSRLTRKPPKYVSALGPSGCGIYCKELYPFLPLGV